MATRRSGTRSLCNKAISPPVVFISQRVYSHVCQEESRDTVTLSPLTLKHGRVDGCVRFQLQWRRGRRGLRAGDPKGRGRRRRVFRHPLSAEGEVPVEQCTQRSGSRKSWWAIIRTCARTYMCNVQTLGECRRPAKDWSRHKGGHLQPNS
jgi:hypothetical protein